MTSRSQALLLALVLSVGAGCQVSDVRSPVLAPVRSGLPVAGSANVTVRISPSAMAVKALGKTFDDVVTVVVTLKSGATTVTSSGLTNPMTITLPTVTGTFTNVPPGTGYTIDVDARDASGTSITSSFSGANTVDIAGGVATYSSGTDLVRTITLNAASASTDTSSSAITAATGTLLTFNQYKWMLVNNGLKATETSTIQAVPTAINLTAVQPGATTGATHDLWMFAAESGSSRALPVQRVAAAANAAGTIPNPFNGTMTSVSMSTPSLTAVTPATGLPMGVDDAANVYYINGANAVIKLSSAGDVYGASTLFTAGAAPTGFATDGAGNVYYSTGNDIKVRRPPLYDTDTTLITTTGVNQIAVDEFKNLYWIDGGSVLTYASNRGGTYTKVVDQGGLGLPLSVPGATMLAADAYGHVYTSNGTDILRRSRSQYGFWDGSASNAGPLYPSVSTVVSATNITGFGVDRAGDVYFTQAAGTSNALNLVPRGGAAGTSYAVAGDGATSTFGADGLNGDPLGAGVVLNFRLALNPMVTSQGVVFCTSIGDGNVGRFLRRIKPN